MPRSSTRPRTRTRTSALRVALATGAVLAVTAGCSAQGVTDPAGGAEDKQGNGTGVRIEPAGPASRTPSDSPAAASKPPATPSATPSPTPSETAAEKPAPPKPEIVLASGAEGDQVRELQARLRQIAHFNRTPTGYYGTVTADAVSSFQAKRGLPRTGTTDTVTWQRLLGMTKKPTAAQLRPPAVEKPPPPKPDERCMTGRVLCISKTSRSLSWMIDGKVKSTMDVRFGSQYTPTREGVFKVGWKSRDHVSTLYDTPMPYAMFFSGGQAVHYSADFAANGYSGASHGCVNVRDKKKIASLFDQVRTGDKVVVYW
ncbi:L,D-transpeptidase family protein [Streptomyces sp. NP-1717]|uniref:L,D-transpeptidase family protein n=1 Tax=Streptomyces sp. NP-1717 TaxID=2704470 RepID=UPI0024145B3F|nr:L,D-transpeptidase family protein [Streptomyces sp. NP-1717]MCI3224164.1 L,D-transpeptidase family protein [Streptomyces sp. NP-1717]